MPPAFAAALAALAASGACAAVAALDAFDTLAALMALRASLTERRLAGPRTGTRSMKTQPTCGTGLPPISRPGSKSHG